MKKALFLSFAFLLTFTIAGCTHKKTDTTEPQPNTGMENTLPEPAEEVGEEYAIDTEKSTITWNGSKVVAGSHSGTIDLKEGKVFVENDMLSAGEFVIDMKTIKDKDGITGLENHLKGEDFFAVETYPEAKFVITDVSAKDAGENMIEITGNLTIKDQTHPITFDASWMQEANNIYIAKADITIDRTKWNVVYGSGKVISVADKIIKDEIVYNIVLQTKE